MSADTPQGAERKVRCPCGSTRFIREVKDEVEIFVDESGWLCDDEIGNLIGRWDSDNARYICARCRRPFEIDLVVSFIGDEEAA